MIEPRFVSVASSSDCEDFEKQVVRFGRDLGFDTVGAMVVVDQIDGSSDFFNFDNTPTTFKARFDDLSIGQRDPVMQHCRHRSTPIVWNQDTYVAAGLGDLWEEQARFGFRYGIAIAMHLPCGRHFMVGVDRDQALPHDSREATRLVSDLQLFTVYAQEAADRLLASKSNGPSQVQRLSPRELEVLRWTMDGKTAWQIGDALGISERTVAVHLMHATRKLRCANKTQAVARALRLGFLG